jgi:hypothetical protein
MSIQDRKDFIAELRNSRVILCKRAACSLSAAIAEDVENKKRIAELESNILMLEQYNGSVESLIKDIKANNLEQQAKGAIKLTNVAMKKLQSPKCSQSRLEYFKAGVMALAFAIDKESKALKDKS